MTPLITIAVIAVVIFATITALLARYERCPSDEILVIYLGSTSAYKLARHHHHYRPR